jgi:hypothetical protein
VKAGTRGADLDLRVDGARNDPLESDQPSSARIVK